MTIVNIDVAEDHLPLIIDRLRHYGALEIDNATTDQQESEGVLLRDLADRIEQSQEITYTVRQDLEELDIIDSLGNELHAETGEGGVEYVSVRVGAIEYFVTYSNEKNVNSWMVESADVQLDRRAATTIALDLPVAKLQDQPEVERLINRFREELT